MKSLKTIAFWLTLITGLLLLFIGARFFLSPIVAENDFGISLNTHHDYSFHYIKGARDIFSGLILIFLLRAKEFRALGIILLCSIVIPFTDLLVVISHPGYQADKPYPHIIAILIGLMLGIYYLYLTSKKNTHATI